MDTITENMKYYNYYYESYSTVLTNFIGDYSIEVENEDGTTTFEDRYGIKAFLPIAKNYSLFSSLIGLNFVSPTSKRSSLSEKSKIPIVCIGIF